MKIITPLNLAIISVALLGSKPVLAQTDEYRYAQIEESFITECMTQPLPPPLKVSASIRSRYCGCYFDFVKNNFSYEEYSRIDKIIRDNPQNVRNFSQKTLALFQKGFEQCYNYATEQGNIKQEQDLTNLKQIEQQLIKLRNQGKLQEAILVAEEIVQKKSAYEETGILV
ncbi:hypothetical protein H6G80_33020 [Nostoc sp. FACHB-87]|uniref:hypothetical protein n=1 Tax=Nostocaceae TaxID=1162 RepID=UPI001682D5E9|nr:MULTISPECIES: hypothetical protein [Nostocaceae]MBD2458864.1 hypothetical protein [Nostoc sp. FACHB-87]MBD2479895.1 hypothetical protein [Anabaena sp. FACHB-83]